MRAPFAFVVAAAWLATACSKPSPPTFTPVSVTATNLTPQGVELSVVMNAANANDVPLSAQSVNAHVVLDPGIDLGTVTSNQPIQLPSKKTIQVTVPLSVKWVNVAALLHVVGSPGDVKYAVDGTVAMGDALLNVNVPFHLDGTMTHEQILQSTAHAIPGLTTAPH